MKSFLLLLLLGLHAGALERVPLASSWKIQNSALVLASGDAVSRTSFNDAKWIAATVPSTVLANLAGPHVGDASIDDPYFGKNWLKLPGSGPYYPIGKNYGGISTPSESPFGHPWWYRRTFEISAAQLRSVCDLHLDGVTYGADIWVNGTLVANASATRGSYRQFRFDVSRLLRAGANTVAILVDPPGPADLTPSWVDWNITPQDKNMGLWRDVFLDFHGPASVHRSFVSTSLGAKGDASLTVETEISATTDFSGEISASLLGFTLKQPVVLKAGETRAVVFSPAIFPQLQIAKPALWWPWQMGQAVLHSLKVSAISGGRASDEQSIRFGIRQVTSKLTPEGSRLFSVNGRPIFIRGGGWSSDLLLRFSDKRQSDELAYVRSLGLNTIRLEGRFETEHLLDLADERGLLVMPGWVCCNAWQNGETWAPDVPAIARASLADQLYELRAHPSVFVFLYGSDEVPPASIEASYLDVFRATHWPNPTLASASDRTSTVGETGVKMTGPYAYTPPSYWYSDDDDKYGGAWGFNTETSPGVSMPPMSSLAKFIPADHLGAIDDVWNFHMGENEFATLDLHRAAIDRRYGPSTSIPEFVRKSELADYDNHRAMFEAYASRKYVSTTGLVQWMLNSAWPSLMWHLYDYYLNPGAAFYGVKKANEPIHVSLDPTSLTVSLVNSTYADVSSLSVGARVWNLSSIEVASASHPVARLRADSAVEVMKLGEPTGLPVYFVSLELRDAHGALVDSNFYWLSAKKEIYDWPATDFKNTPLLQEADFSMLAGLPRASVAMSVAAGGAGASASGGSGSGASGVSVSPTRPGASAGSLVVTLRNTGRTLAFFVHLDLFAGTHEVLPVDWSENNISLIPGETRVLHVRALAPVSGALRVTGSGWNVPAF